ncbi:MAG: hypothetical protein PHU14_09750 [Methylovulum sp.]|nr:hypothetical protein [Methylovulum sp.]
MKKNNLINGLFATLLIASPLAGADQKYPAADFQPQVVFQDSDYIAKNSPAKAAPAAKVAQESASDEVDSKYPAANFKPQVVYSDPNYKPSASSASVAVPAAASEASVAIENTSVAETAKAESQSNYLIGLIGLGLVGAFLFKSQFKCSGKKAAAPVAPTAPAAKGALTGVARYLNKVSGTGVSRYLEKQVKSTAHSPSTGVAKYIAKQVSVAKSTAAGAATGVEKYMRNRG